ncbi:23S rRNA (guanosine(2251)-2'-O)-methyltransferase RlmB [Effusibacillus dendaii]|uniref:23S rRNA (Guanosine(2251)-2'-O)-methyltransferase RlmB n=2 Tax=Effusibacillus dendaii TaxID=2743772 RepID=A0A7I8DAZ8_9BACL|nr:23S rRNA (guanosine(2251)-2'-O)-methyltransferase RlmB [Effusibacillus dendaii]
MKRQARGKARPDRANRMDRTDKQQKPVRKESESARRGSGRRVLAAERTQPNMEQATEQLEGRHPVIEALKSGRELNKILLAEGVEGGSSNEILARAKERGIVVQRVPKAKMDSIATTRNHQGVIAYLAAKEYAELEDILQAAQNSPRPGLIVVLDEIEDPFNFGSILRTADGAGAHGVVIPKRRAVPLTATVAKSSAGAIEHIPVARISNVSQTLELLKKAGYWVVGTDVEADLLYHQADMTQPTVLVIGNEGKGLGEVVKKRCDYLVRLPMIGQVQSLNAGVAAGILLYESVRQRGSKK